MLRTFWNSKSAMNSMQTKLETISNNLANVNTTGYKKVDVNFEDLLQESLDRKGYPVSKGGVRNLQTGTGVRVTDITRDLSEGNLMPTDKKTDFAIDGDGIFKVYRQDGTAAYTRSGDFNINPNGKLVDYSGNRVSILDENGNEISDKVVISEKNFIMDEKGNIYQNEGERRVKVGTIGVYTALGDKSFKSIGNNLYVPASDDVQVTRSNNCDVLQGFLELSNVDLGQEMSQLIMTQRAFQLNSTALRTADEMWGMANNLKR
ncbi:flagellar hook-basal body complex protein [Haloimpatiens sp. FM7330]|uniref:flagellar hook-basal body complex protein n=1 Tax=Haloimpatiens sp. FM7330 TaxID=3298610 RepID=UPI003643B5EE